MDLGLEGRTAVVFGASSGLGLASAEALREEGADVVKVARRHDVSRRKPRGSARLRSSPTCSTERD